MENFWSEINALFSKAEMSSKLLHSEEEEALSIYSLFFLSPYDSDKKKR